MANTVPPGKSASDPKPLHQDDVNVFTEPKNAQVWLEMIIEAERVMEDWNQHCDNIDKQFANIERLSEESRDRQFQMFWANIQVLSPSIYARPPIPVVVPKFKDRRPVFTAASEMAERCTVVAFDLTRIHDTMLDVRNDLTLYNRGAVWCRHERGRNGRFEKVCIEHKNRRDFLHSPARCWYEVQWVAAASYMTREEARKRFAKYSGDEYDKLDYKIDKEKDEIGGSDERERAKVWEVWHRGIGRVIWVSEGCERLLDDADPHLDLQDYFPCPKPAYGTVQPGSLVPVPDVLYYRDQLEELNQLTGRIHALAEALRVKGFYPGGGGEMADAIEAALKLNSNSAIMVPISNWAQFGGSKEVIVWLPIDQVANTITATVGVRKQIIDDIYQIVGLSDIMRGSTDPDETLGAQQLKMQSGSVRIRDKQSMMAQIAKDCVHITTEIITEKFEDSTILAMSQMELPTEADIQQQKQGLMMKAQQVMMKAQQEAQQPQISGPPQPGQPPQGGPPQQQQGGQGGQQQQAGPEAALQEIQQQLEALDNKPTQEKVIAFLRDNRAKSFVLDIETDSTIQLDEQFEKQQRGEFLGVLAQLLPQIGGMVQQMPSTAQFAGEILKFAVAPYRVGRQLDGAIDDMVQQLGKMQAQDGGVNGKGTEKTEDPAKLQLEREKLQWQTQENDKDRMLQMAEMQTRQKAEQDKLLGEQNVARLEYEGNERERQAKIMQINAQMARDREKHAQDMQKTQADIILGTQKQQMARQGMQDKQNFQRSQMAQKSQENEINRQQRAQQFDMAQKQRAQQQRLNPRGNP